MKGTLENIQYRCYKKYTVPRTQFYLNQHHIGLQKVQFLEIGIIFFMKENFAFYFTHYNNNDDD